MRNNPPQRGGEQSLSTIALKGQRKTNPLPFQGEIYGEALTHRVAVGCYAMPLKGRGKNL
jgi:hypothetical protein